MAPVSAFLLASAASAVSPDFETYKNSFDKVYATPAQEAYARACWEATVKDIVELQEGNTMTSFDENEFSDICFADFASQRMTLDQINGVCSKSGVDPYPSGGDESQAIDYREQGYVNPVKDQKSCGSCWAFASVGALEGAHFKATGELVSLSEQQLVSCDKAVNSGCNGGMPGEAFQYVTKQGIALEKDYPYSGRDGSCQYRGGGVSFDSWRYITSNKQGGENILLNALQHEGPIAITVMANKAWHSYSGGIMMASQCPATRSISHAVLAVGFGIDKGTKYWLIRNSWASRWGEGGYVRMEYGKSMCGITACLSALPIGKAGNQANSSVVV